MANVCNWQCPVNLDDDGSFVKIIDGPYYDAEGYQQGARINGCCQCPDCGLIWPLIEGVEAWRDGGDGKWIATEWGPGTAECIECGVVMVSWFGGTAVIRPPLQVA